MTLETKKSPYSLVKRAYLRYLIALKPKKLPNILENIIKIIRPDFY
jgi:hypothetical protein